METDWFKRLWERSKKSLVSLSKEDFLSLIRTKCEQVVTEKELKTLLSKGGRLNIKLGVDATGEMHLGHAVPLMLLRLFQRRGHNIYFVIGDFTARIGDPSGKTEKRKELTESDVRKNLHDYKNDVARLIDIKKTKIYKNSTWLSKMRLDDYFRVIGFIGLSEVSQRDDFRKRLSGGKSVSLREANYASLMAIDSLYLKTDIEVGAVDQLLNMMQARSVLQGSGRKPEVVVTTPLIEGTSGDGRKMSKSLDNYIALSAPAEEQFGLLMSIPDHVMQSYYQSFGDIYEREVDELASFIKKHPLSAKKDLALFVVSLIHGESKAKKSALAFERRFAKKEYVASDEVAVTLSSDMNVIDALFTAFGGKRSKSYIRGLIEQKGVRYLSGNTQDIIVDPTESVKNGQLMKVGKRFLFRFIIKR